jgi:hypothetical protein
VLTNLIDENPIQITSAGFKRRKETREPRIQQDLSKSRVNLAAPAVQTIQWSALLQSTNDKENFHHPDPSTKVIFNVSRSIDDYSSHDIDIIKLAAEFLLNCGLYAHAFPLYHLIWKKLRNDAVDSLKALKALETCVRCAVTETDLKTIGDTLLDGLEEYMWMEFHATILRTLQAIVNRRQSRSVEKSAVEVLHPMTEDTLAAVSLDNAGFNLQFFCCLSLGFCLRASRLPTSWRSALSGDVPDRALDSLKSFRQKLLERTPSIFSHQVGAEKRSTVRAFVDWCSSEIQSATHPILWRHLCTSSIDRQSMRSTLLFLFLWSSGMQRSKLRAVITYDC